MGCCHYTDAELLAGISLPEQECVISEIEKTHPFRTMDVRTVSAQVVGLQRSVLSAAEFAGLCTSLGVSVEVFRGENRELRAFVSALKEEGRIDAMSLLVAGVLLGMGTFETKFELLLDSCKTQRGFVTRAEFEGLLERIIRVATVVLPNMSTFILRKNSLEMYLNRLKTAQGSLIEEIVGAVGGGDLWRTSEVLNKLRMRPDLQKIVWSNGVRMLLIELGLRKLGATGKTVPRTAKEETIYECTTTVANDDAT